MVCVIKPGILSPFRWDICYRNLKVAKSFGDSVLWILHSCIRRIDVETLIKDGLYSFQWNAANMSRKR